MNSAQGPTERVSPRRRSVIERTGCLVSVVRDQVSELAYASRAVLGSGAVMRVFLKRVLAPVLLAAALTPLVGAAEIQGVLADWKCTERMVRDGREKIYRQDKSCSLVRNPDRAGYGLITDEKKYYRLDNEGNNRAKMLLHDSHDKDNLHVIVTGVLDGNLIKVQFMSIL